MEKLQSKTNFFFQTILNKTKTFRTGTRDSRHFLHAFLKTIHMETIKKNDNIAEKDLIIADERISEVIFK